LPGLSALPGLEALATLHPVAVVFLAALITALATGLGALPLIAMRAAGVRALGFGNALAAGLMLAASLSLVIEGAGVSVVRTGLGALLGVALILAAQRWMAAHDTPSVAALKGADARKALLIMGIMTVHSAAEGVGVGVAFGGREGLGEFITLAIALHNIPEGLAIALVLVPRGVGIGAAAGWAIVSSLPQPLLAVPAYLFIQLFAPVLPVGLGLAAGAMLWMVATDLLPDASRALPRATAGLSTTAAFAAMTAITVWMIAESCSPSKRSGRRG
jgi:zinc transporter ZupT